MFQTFGNWYQMAAELYLGLSSYLWRYSYLIVFYAFHLVLDPLYKNKSIRTGDSTTFTESPKKNK